MWQPACASSVVKRSLDDLIMVVAVDTDPSTLVSHSLFQRRRIGPFDGYLELAGELTRARLPK